MFDTGIEPTTSVVHGRRSLIRLSQYHGLSQTAVQPSLGRPLLILDGHLKKTAFGRLFIILTVFGLFINFMMAGIWLPQLTK